MPPILAEERAETFSAVHCHKNRRESHWHASGTRRKRKKVAGTLCRNGPKAGSMLAWSSHKCCLPPFPVLMHFPALEMAGDPDNTGPKSFTEYGNERSG
jgi:hypothetical protein